MKIYEGKVCPPGDGKIAIIVSRFNKTITEHMLTGALEKLRQNSVNDENITVVWVPGAFELPTLAQRFAEDEDYQAVICLGCVIKGETTHDQHINRAVSLEIARIGAEFGLPVIFGVLTCNTVEQALVRSGQNEQSRDKTVDPTAGNKGAESAEAALEMIDLFLQLPELPLEEPTASVVANAEQYRLGNFNDESNKSYFDDEEEDEFEEDDETEWFQPGRSSSSRDRRSSDSSKNKGNSHRREHSESNDDRRHSHESGRSHSSSHHSSHSGKSSGRPRSNSGCPGKSDRPSDGKRKK